MIYSGIKIVPYDVNCVINKTNTEHMKKLLAVSIFLLCCFSIHAQNNRWYDVSKNGDCISAIEISIKDTINAIASPVGYGQLLEFKNNDKKSLLYIEREHNTVWYQFEMPADGKLAFELTPFNAKDDYDFMLFQYAKTESDDFCAAIINKTIQPIRTNISRNNKDIQSKTGMVMEKAVQSTVHSGPGDDYSQFVEAKKGDRFYLLVDNVYKKGEGHRIVFHYTNESKEEIIVFKEAPQPIEEEIEAPPLPQPKKVIPKKDIREFTLEGVVIDDETNKPIQADVSLINSKSGKVVAQTQSDSLTGEYKITLREDADVLPKQQYTLEIYKDGYFFDSEDIKAYDLPDLSSVKSKKRIPKLKKNSVFRITNINFYGDQAKPLPRSFTVFKTLLKTMKKNKTLKIKIEGHTNGCSKGKAFSSRLSEARTETVKNYLIKNGIAADRIEVKGFGCKNMLYPEPMNSKQHMLNRRVEIRVLEY